MHFQAKIPATANLDINLQVFDIIGRTAPCNSDDWIANQYKIAGNDEKAAIYFHKEESICNALVLLISNNPTANSPSKDSQAIDIAIASWILASKKSHHRFIEKWHLEIVTRSR